MLLIERQAGRRRRRKRRRGLLGYEEGLLSGWESRVPPEEEGMVAVNWEGKREEDEDLSGRRGGREGRRELLGSEEAWQEGEGEGESMTMEEGGEGERFIMRRRAHRRLHGSLSSKEGAAIAQQWKGRHCHYHHLMMQRKMLLPSAYGEEDTSTED